MTVNDILTSQSILVKTKSLMDQLKYGKKTPILMERLQFIMENFNMGEVHENSRGKNLREFNNFFIKNDNDSLYLFDKMDVAALEDSRAEEMRSAIQDAQDRVLPPDELSGAGTVVGGLEPAGF